MFVTNDSIKKNRQMFGSAHRSGGSAIVMVMAMSLATMGVAVGTALLMMPSLSKLTCSRFSDVSRSKCEAAVDWTIQQLNDSATRDSIDGTTVTVPSNILGGSTFTGTVKIVNTSAPTYSYLYDPLADPSNANAGISGGNGWRVLEAKITNGTLKKEVRVILKPVYQSGVSTVTDTTTVTVPGTPTAIFVNSLFANNAITGNGNMTTDSYDPSNTSAGFMNKYGDVGSNSGIQMNGNVTIGGNMVVDSSPAGSTSAVVASAAGKNNYVYGNVSTNGVISNITAGGTVTQSATAAPQQMPPVPSAPATATNLGTINLAGKDVLTISQPGDYIVNSITMAGQAAINITANGPVNIYVQGTGSNNVSISGLGIINNSGDPANVRLWDGSSGDITLSGQGNFNGVIYAPNANLSIPGNGVLYGAAVVGTATLSGNGTFHYDRQLSTSTSLTWTPPITKTVSTTVTSPVENLSHFQAVSWSEY